MSYYHLERPGLLLKFKLTGSLQQPCPEAAVLSLGDPIAFRKLPKQEAGPQSLQSHF